MKFRKRKAISIITAFVMAVTVFGCTSISFAAGEEAENETNVNLQEESTEPVSEGEEVVNVNDENSDGQNEPEAADEEQGPNRDSILAAEETETLTVTATGGKYMQVPLKWTEVQAPEGTTVTYVIRDAGGQEIAADVTGTSYTVKGLSPRKAEYVYTVEAIGTDSEGDATILAEGISKAVTTADFSAQRLNPNKIFADPGYKAVLLQWNRLEGATGYRIYRRIGGERGNIDSAKCSDGRTLKTYRSKKTRKYERIQTPGSFELVKEVPQPSTATVTYRDGDLKVMNHSYVYFYQYMIVPIYKDSKGTIVSSVFSDANKKTANKNNYGTNTKIHVIKQNTVLPMYVLYKVKVDKPYYNTYKPSDLKHRGRFSKGHLVIGYSRTEGRFQFYEKKNVSNPSKTYWFAQKNSTCKQGYYINNGSKTNMSRKDWATGYSKKTVLDYVNHAGLSSKTKYLVWVSKYAQHVYIFTGSKGNWKLYKSGKNVKPGWSNLCASGSVALQSRNGDYKIYAKQKKAKRKKYDYYYVSKLHSTVRLHSLLYKKGKSFSSKKYYSKVLGNPISNGCVRLRPETAQHIYNNIPKKTKVRVY